MAKHEPWCEGAHIPPVTCWHATRMRRLNTLDPARCTRGEYHSFTSSDPQAPCDRHCGTILKDLINYRSTVPTVEQYLREIGGAAGDGWMRSTS